MVYKYLNQTTTVCFIEKANQTDSGSRQVKSVRPRMPINMKCFPDLHAVIVYSFILFMLNYSS